MLAVHGGGRGSGHRAGSGDYRGHRVLGRRAGTPLHASRRAAGGRAGGRSRFFPAAIGWAASFLTSIRITRRSKRSTRISWVRAYVQRSTTVRDASYQPRQSKIAVGTGGVLGVGLMEGKQKLMFLPDAHTDFIYATVGEELGLWGATAVLAGFIVILWRGARLFVLRRRRFRKIPGAGRHGFDRRAGVYQHERGAGHGSHQGIPASDDQFRRQFVAEHAAMPGDAVECQ